MPGPSTKSKASKNDNFDFKLDAWLLTLPARDGVDNLHTALRSAGKSIPRYLFRTWNAESGGNRRLNTPDALTPLAFLQKTRPPATIFDIDKRQLLGLIYGHLENTYVRTPFSSWSHSLQFAISMVRYTRRNAHVSVIDTRALKPENFIFHCGSPGLAGMSIPSFDEEFLIYGVVDGPAHRAIPLEDLTTFAQELLPDTKDYLHNLIQGSLVQLARSPALSTHAKQIHLAKEFSRSFGPEFELPVAIALLSARGDISKSCRLHELMIAEFAIPTAWSTDPTFPGFDSDESSYTKEVAVARKTAASLVRRLQARGRQPKKGGKKKGGPVDLKEEMAGLEIEGTEDEEEEEEKVGPKNRGQTAGRGRHLKKSARMPKDLYQLYIDMVGFDDHNEAMRK